MKKYFVIFISVLILVLNVNIAKADETFIRMSNDYSVTDSQIEELNTQAKKIADNYGLAVYFIMDFDITDDNIAQYTANILNSSNYPSILVLSVSTSYYLIDHNGRYSRQLNTWEEMLWKEFIDSASVYSGVKAYLNRVETILQNKTPSVVDMYGLLTENQENQLTRKLDAIRKKYGFDIVIVTNYALNGLSPTEFVDDFVDYNNYRNDNIALLVSMEERDWATSTEGAGLDYFTDYGLKLIEDRLLENLRTGNYYEAFDRFADDCDSYIAQGKAGDPVNYHPTFSYVNIIVALVVALIGMLIGRSVMKGKMKSVYKERYANNYLVQDSFTLTGYSNHFITSRTSRTPRPKHTSSSGSSGHYSSSGSFHGGHSGKF